MSDIAIKVEGLSKLYRLGNVDAANFVDDIARTWASIRGKEDPAIKLAELNDRTEKKGLSPYVWALRDVNFEVKQGEVVGIIGRNGAGKSTLLKILSKVTAPTSGFAKAKGRIASLLEVGTGFHPELTGKENMYLNGHILGMRKKEIDSKLDEIIEFAGIEKYLDTPVKRYSSGMYVRLAFAVAAHLEPEILIIDEVLAVGDAEFQKKCLGKMNDVSKKDGRTILFVSHNIASIRQLCTKGILMVNGELAFRGGIDETINRYAVSMKKTDLTGRFENKVLEGTDVELLWAEVSDCNGEPRQEFGISEEVTISLKFVCVKKVPNLYGYIVVKNKNEEVIIESDTLDYPPNCLDEMQIGENNYRIRIKPYILAHGEYSFYLNLGSTFADSFNVASPKDILTFSVVDNETDRGVHRNAKTSQLLKWEIQDAI